MSESEEEEENSDNYEGYAELESEEAREERGENMDEEKSHSMNEEENEGEESEIEKQDNEEKQTDEERKDEIALSRPNNGRYFESQYSGHCNIRTVKSVSFFGPDNDYVCSGSDDGRIFIWDKTSCKLMNIKKGDSYVITTTRLT